MGDEQQEFHWKRAGKHLNNGCSTVGIQMRRSMMDYVIRQESFQSKYQSLDFLEHQMTLF